MSLAIAAFAVYSSTFSLNYRTPTSNLTQKRFTCKEYGCNYRASITQVQAGYKCSITSHTKATHQMAKKQAKKDGAPPPDPPDENTDTLHNHAMRAKGKAIPASMLTCLISNKLEIHGPRLEVRTIMRELQAEQVIICRH